MADNYSEIHKNIIEQSKKGNKKAQVKLYNLYARSMFNICVRMVNNIEEAEDLLQDSFSEAFYKLDYFRYESSFGAWLKRIVINKCINHLKSKKIEFVLADDINNFETYPNEESNEEMPELQIEKVKNAIGKLPDGYRIVLSLYLLEGYTHDEIAEILNITSSTSKSQYLRAKKKLIEILNAK